MRHHVLQLFFLLSLLTLASCGGAPTKQADSTRPALSPTPKPTATLSPTATATPKPPTGFVLYTSPDHTYQVAYPAGWQPISPTGPHNTVDFTGPNQLFEVVELGRTTSSDSVQVVNTFCQKMQAGVAPNPVQTSNVNLAGQTWTRANCDAGAQGPAIDLIVEVVIYQGAAYQLDYTSAIVEFASDDAAYYGPMEQSFRFLH